MRGLHEAQAGGDTRCGVGVSIRAVPSNDVRPAALGATVVRSVSGGIGRAVTGGVSARHAVETGWSGRRSGRRPPFPDRRTADRHDLAAAVHVRLDPTRGRRAPNAGKDRQGVGGAHGTRLLPAVKRFVGGIRRNAAVERRASRVAVGGRVAAIAGAVSALHATNVRMSAVRRCVRVALARQAATTRRAAERR